MAKKIIGARIPRSLRWGAFAAWLGWEVFGLLRAVAIGVPVLKAMWAPVLGGAH